MDAIDDAGVTEVVVMKSAQVGWTEIINNAIGRGIHRRPGPMMLLQPTLEMAEAWSKDRFAPMIRDTTCIRDLIADPKSRDSGNTLLHKKFTGGHLTIVGANSAAGLASRPIRDLYCDEVDRYPESAGTEGDPIDLARRRTLTFRNRKVLIGSTPTVKGASRIEAAFDQSDQRYYFVPCPHCDEFQRLLWDQVKWQEEKPETACYVCKACGTLLTDADKPDMLRRGEWRSSKPFNGVAGFHISELYSPWSSWPEMATAFLRAKKFPETLQTWINTALGETWVDEGNTPKAEALLERAEPYTADLIPSGVLLLTIGTDVQDDRLETTIIGWGADEESWRIKHIVLRGDPGGDALWAEHDEILRERFTTEDGRSLVIEAGCVDSGGHFTQHVYAYCQKRVRNRIYAIKGVGGTGRLAWPKQATRTKTRAMVWIIGVDTIKDLLYGRLSKVEKAGAGFIHFDATTTQVWLDQLTSEVKKYRTNRMGRKVAEFLSKTVGAAHEALDCCVYAYAAMVSRGGAERLRLRNKTQVKRAEEKVLESTPPVAEQPRQEDASPATTAPKRGKPQQIYRSNWIKSWRR